MSFAIANNLLAPNTKAIDLRISQQTIVATIYNKSENLENGSFGMKNPNKCSYTILENPPKEKWGGVIKAWANKVLPGQKCVQVGSQKRGGGLKEGGVASVGQQWCPPKE